MNSMKRQKNTTLKDELSGAVNAQRRVENNTRKNEETETKQNTTQLWMWLVMEEKSNAVKNNIA